MNYKEINKAIINSLYPLIGEYGFLIDTDKYGTSFYIKNKKIYFSFGYSLREGEQIFNYNIYSKHWLKIAFPEVEKIVHPILAKNNLFGKSISYDEVGKTFYVKKEFKNVVSEDGIEINDKNDLDEPIDLLKRFFKEDALPFFEHWHNLTALYAFIKDKNDEELWDILGQFAPIKKSIIYRLCNDKSALLFINNYYEEQKGYYEENPKDSDNVRYYNASKELKEILETTQPIYNIKI